MVENTRVPANTEQVEQARDVKERYDDTWSDVMAFYAEHRDADAHTELTATVRPEVDADALADAGERIDEVLAEHGDSLTFDDVKAACEAALDEKLPEGVGAGR